MKINETAREIAAACRAAKVSSLIVFVLCGAMCISALLTLGQSTLAKAALERELETRAARTITITRGGGVPTFEPRAIHALESFTDQELTLGVSSAKDTYNGLFGPGSQAIPLRMYHGQWENAITLIHGRLPAEGEVIIPRELAKQAGFEYDFGYLVDRDGREYPVVGSFTSRGLAPGIDETALGNSPEAGIDKIYVLARNTQSLGRLATRISVTILQAPYENARLEMPPDTRALTAKIRAQFGNYSSQLLLLILSLGALLITATTFGQVISHAEDLGRRRVLGASRPWLLGFVIGSVTLPAALGAIAGCAGGLLYSYFRGGVPDASFSAALLVLTVITAACAAILPSLYAAWRDPILVLHKS